MDFRRFDQTYYIRMDKGDEIIGTLLEICRKEKIASAVFSGIGGCSEADIQIFDPAAGMFETRKLSGMLELVSLNGNIFSDEEGEVFHHTHALFSFSANGVHGTAGGHIGSMTVLYTAEIELRPVIGGTIRRKPDPETGTGFWDF
ncbi:MAG: DUF296 domain-containing protein [Clostridia bacterium]|nr:DUF296 domain-containing protein [Clostridia bacterium]